MIKLLCQTASGWSGTHAWMVDKDGNAVPIDNHVQKGEDIESQLDEGGIACALRYSKLVGDKQYYQAACILAQEEIFSSALRYEPDEVVNLEEEISYLVEPRNAALYKEALRVSRFKATTQEIAYLYKKRKIAAKADRARQVLHTLYERLMMRVRVGGLINTSVSGSTDIYFRIPDTQVNGWYTAIGNFLYDHPQYAGFTLHIYEEADTASARKELESYTDGREFLDLHASRDPDSFKARRLDSSYKRSELLKQRFLNSLRDKN